jgi:PBSX family phage terminase large subunit
MDLGNHKQFTLTDKQKELRDLCASAAENILCYGGSRSGKTFEFVYNIITRALKASNSRHVIFRKTGVSVKQAIGMDTYPEVMRLAYPEICKMQGYKLGWNDKHGYFKLPNGSEIWLSGLDDKERVDKVLGKEYATMYFNEASEIPLPSFDVALTRLAQTVKDVNGKWLQLKCYVDLNPTTKSHWTYRMFVDGIHPDGEIELDLSKYVYMTVNPKDNIENLHQSYLDRLANMPERQRKRFWDGVYTGDVENALWRRSYFKRTQKLPELQRIIVAIDPAISNDVGSDETGIIVAGVSAEGKGYILEDASGKYRPEEWASRAVALYDEYSADRIIAEINQGGDMVGHTIRTVRQNIPYSSVRATRGKVIRAEPIASLYERGKIIHYGDLSTLEDQLCVFTIDFDRKSQGYSPDRLDALVWALTELFPSIVTKTKKTVIVQPPSRKTYWT